jgi:YHS domain-containing protein
VYEASFKEKTKMKELILLLVLIFILPHVVLSQSLDTLKIDAVELVNGKEIQGMTKYVVVRDNYAYLFASSTNKKIFEKQPEKYEIQLGGACGRMGILSGKGRTDLFTVHNDKIFIFASQSCKNTFLKDPSRVLEQDDARPEATEESLLKGMELLNKALQALGGAEKIDAVVSYQEKTAKETEYQGKNVEVTNTKTFVYPDKFRTDDTWAEWAWGMVASPTDAFQYSAQGYRKMIPLERKALQKKYSRNIVYLLKARNEEGFIASASGKGTIGDREVDLLTVHFNGVANTLGMDPESGRILSISYRDFGPNMFLGQVEKYFSDFRLVDGLVLPMTVSGTFEGKIAPQWSKTIKSVSINEIFGEDFFSRK